MAADPRQAPSAAGVRDGLAAALAHELDGLAAGPRMAALAFDVLSRQAEGRLLFAGTEYVERRAEEHHLKPDEARTSAGNLVVVLGRGAETDAERTLLAVAAVRGFGRAWTAADAASRAALVTRFVRHLDFLELATPLSLVAALDVGLEPDPLDAVQREIAQRIVDEGSGERARSPQARARNAARLSALAGSASDSARRALASVLSTRGLEPALQALGTALVPALAVGPEDAVLDGVRARPRRSPLVDAARLLTGIALVGWALRGLLALVGARREVCLRLSGPGLEIEERTRAFGRVLRSRRTTFAFAGIRSVEREVRYPRLHLYVGAIALALGVLVGGIWIFDGVRGGDFVLAAIGAALLLGGAVFDLTLDVLVPAQRGRVTLEVSAERGQHVRVAGLDLTSADAFALSLRQRLK
jgi:hypothetical protein